MRRQEGLFVSVVVLVLLGVGETVVYENELRLSGKKMFQTFEWFTQDSPTHGYVDYVGSDEAFESRLAQVIDATNEENGQIYLGVDSENIAQGRGRKSIRLQSWKTWNEGVFIVDLEHMPHGCGSWPAFWLCGDNWPFHGEIDIIEGINDQLENMMTLHTSENCSFPDKSRMTGTWMKGELGQNDTDCAYDAKFEEYNQGCSIYGGNYGDNFNKNRGGVYVTEVAHDVGIQIWYFPRDSIPADIEEGNFVNPELWGAPTANFIFGDHCDGRQHFANLRFVININFCGDRGGGAQFSQACGGDCVEFVRDNPSQFEEAYWLINYIQVFERVQNDI